MSRPGAPPKGPPPTGGNRGSVAQSAASKSTKTAEPAKPQQAAAPVTNIPKAPPINYFYSWIKGEPFGENVPQASATGGKNNMPESIPKVEDNISGDDISHLSFLTDNLGGMGDTIKAGEDIFGSGIPAIDDENVNPNPPGTMAHALWE